MRVGIIGAGYVGLVTSVVLAAKGHKIICVDKNERLLSQLNDGSPAIYEPGIDRLLKQALIKRKLKFKPADARYLADCDLIFLCVDTPSVKGKMDLTHFSQGVKLAAQAVKKSDKFISIVVKSTVLPGTTLEKAKKIAEAASGKRHGSFGLASNPEFLREGNAIDDFINADRIIIGSEDKRTEKRLLKLYDSWKCEKITVNSNTAEFIKYVSNSLLAMLISFSNEMASISMDDDKISYSSVLKGLKADKRINPVFKSYGRVNPEILSYLTPGPGYGGSCFPKDVEAFSSYAKKKGIIPHALNAIQKINSNQPAKIISLIEKSVRRPYSKKYLVLGFSHKPNTNDSRNSVTIPVINHLLAGGANVHLHDPVALNKAEVMFRGRENISFVENWKGYLEKADVIVLLTGWEEYRDIVKPEFLKKIIGKYVVDTRLFFNPETLRNSNYISF